MNHILKYLSFVLFGIIIYLLLRNIGKKERFSIGIQAVCGIPCDFSFGDELDWSTCKNPLCSPMIIDYHNQGQCGTCSIYALASLFECMYNIKNTITAQGNGLPIPNPISISPQSILDILGRYRLLYPGDYGDNTPRSIIYTNYQEMNDRNNQNFTYRVTDNSCNMCSNSNQSNCFNVKGCGFHWWLPGQFFFNFEYIYELKNGVWKDNPIYKDLIDKMTEHSHFPFPLLKKGTIRANGIPYTEVTTICDKRYLFNETHDRIHDPNYNYTDYFDPESFVDFNIGNLTDDRGSIFPLIEGQLTTSSDITLEEFKNRVKQNLHDGPLLMNIEIDLQDGDVWEHGLIDLELEIETSFPKTNHEFLLIGYKGDNAIILNSWAPHPDDGQSGIQHYITNDITFEVLYNNLANNDNFNFNLNKIEIILPPTCKDNFQCSNRAIASGYKPNCICEFPAQGHHASAVIGGLGGLAIILGLGARCAARMKGNQPIPQSDSDYP